ncbi:MAG: dihydropteroate synthase, partial [Planctomycetota bacterium]
MHWKLATNRTLDFTRPRLMGVLNVTPDSFSDGGAYATTDAAVVRALEMVRDGAQVIDVGGESTRPGADRIDADEQIQRVVPVIEKIRAEADVFITIDTTRAAVAAAALDAGADAINDVSAGLEDDAMLALAASRGCGIILMHRLLPPELDSYSDRYETPPVFDDVVRTTRAFLQERMAAAQRAGVA